MCLEISAPLFWEIEWKTGMFSERVPNISNTAYVRRGRRDVRRAPLVGGQDPRRQLRRDTYTARGHPPVRPVWWHRPSWRQDASCLLWASEPPTCAEPWRRRADSTTALHRARPIAPLRRTWETMARGSTSHGRRPDVPRGLRTRRCRPVVRGGHNTILHCHFLSRLYR
jgi:hypothetical protein